MGKTLTATKVDLSGKYAIVTGASPLSLGYETAQKLAEWGAHVLVSRRIQTDEIVDELRARDLNVKGHDLDLSDTKSVSTFTNWYLSEYGERLDILINNAGIHQDFLSKRKTPELTPDGLEIHWRTNYLGTAHLTLNLLPLLRQTGQTYGEVRIVNVVSQLHSKANNADVLDANNQPYNSWRAYGRSKLALIHFTRELHRRYAKKDNLKAFSLHPGGAGGVRTNIASKGLEGHGFLQALMKLGKPLEPLFMASALDGAQTQLYCATSDEAVSGQYYQNCAIHKASDETRDQETATRLWDETAKWIEGLAG